MKRKVINLKRLVAGSTALLMLLTFSGCGRKQNVPTTTENVIENVIDDNSLESSNITNPETNDTIVEKKVEEQAEVVETTNETDNDFIKESTEKEKIKELQKKYKYVSSPVTRNDKRYVKVRSTKTGYGYVNLDTLEEDIPADKYDFISDEMEYNGHNYVWVSVYDDNNYNHGLLSLDTLNEVIPCKTYRHIDVVTNDDIDTFECLQPDKETVDTYEPTDNGPKLVLTKQTKVEH